VTVREAPPLRRRSHWVSWLIIAMVLGVVTLVSVTGTAPDRVLMTSPADGATLARAPEVFSLLAGADVNPELSHLSVSPAGGGRPVSAETPRWSGGELQSVLSGVGAGDYIAAYHVVLADGTTITGTVRFAVGTDREPAEAQAAGEHEHGSRDPFNLVLLLVDLVVLAILVLAGFRRLTRRH